MRIITVSREFGSGGRELGKRLADALNISYYDREIITAVAERTNLDEKYVEIALDQSVLSQIPISYSRTFSLLPDLVNSPAALLAQQHKAIEELAARGDCVIVGRNAETILKDFHPLKLFVYADKESKIERCLQRETKKENLSVHEIEKMMKQIDKARATNHDILSSFAWGDKREYHLCINTSGIEIKTLIPSIASYAGNWFVQMQK